jgi:hypothetical protein
MWIIFLRHSPLRQVIYNFHSFSQKTKQNKTKQTKNNKNNNNKQRPGEGKSH